MTDDLTQKVADALRDGLTHFGISGDEESGEAAILDLARAALDAIIAQGGVTVAGMQVSTARAVVGSRTDTGAVNMEPLWNVVGSLVARAIVTACAERDAEIERLRANGNLYLTRAHTAEGLLRAALDGEADR